MVWQRAAPGATPDTRLQPRQQRKPNVPAPTRRAGLPYPISAPPLTPQTQGTMCEASGRASLNTAQLAYGVAYELTTYSLATVRGGGLSWRNTALELDRKSSCHSRRYEGSSVRRMCSLRLLQR